jgi:hypothetical protein
VVIVTTTDPPLLDAALRDAEHTIYAFPARTRRGGDGRKKLHPINDWDGQSTTDPMRILSWFGPTGMFRDETRCIDCRKSRLVVIDPDSPTKHPDAPDGVGNWAALAAEHDIPGTWVAHTPSGGQHWYYRADPDRPIGNSVGKLAPGIDVRGDGGFVVAPPSTDYRGSYRWGAEGEPEWDALPTVPPVVHKLLNPPRETFREHTGRRRFTMGEAREFSRPALDSLAAADEGHRNNRLNVAALTLSHFVPNFWSRAEAEKMLYAALDPTYPPDEAAATVDSAFRATDWLAERTPDPENGIHSARWIDRIVDLRPFLDGTYTPPQPSIGNVRRDGVCMLYPGRWHVMGGITTAGKSLFAVWQTLGVIQAGEHVVYLHSEECDPGGTTHRLVTFGAALGIDIDTLVKHFHWVSCETRWEVGEMEHNLRHLPVPALVILDGINAAVGKQGSDVERTEAVGQYRSLFVTPAVVTGAAVLSMGHPVKDRKRQTERHTFGSTAWLDELDGVGFRLEANRRTPIGIGRLGFSTLFTTKDRYGQVEQHGLIVPQREPGWRQFGQFTVDDTGERSKAWLTVPRSEDTDCPLNSPDPDEMADEVAVLDAIHALKENKMEPNMRNIQATMTGVRRSRRADAVNRLVVNRRLVETKGPRGARVFGVAPADGQ